MTQTEVAGIEYDLLTALYPALNTYLVRIEREHPGASGIVEGFRGTWSKVVEDRRRERGGSTDYIGGPKLGLATTRELLQELWVRIETGAGYEPLKQMGASPLDYRTVGGGHGQDGPAIDDTLYSTPPIPPPPPGWEEE